MLCLMISWGSIKDMPITSMNITTDHMDHGHNGTYMAIGKHSKTFSGTLPTCYYSSKSLPQFYIQLASVPWHFSFFILLPFAQFVMKN